jgi:hypothetical protein
MTRHALHQAFNESAVRPFLPPAAGMAAVPRPAGAPDTTSLAPSAGPWHYHYGYRPAVNAGKLHGALPGRNVTTAADWASTASACGVTAYFTNGENLGWGDWLALTACRPGYERHLILQLLADAPARGLSVDRLVHVLSSIDVHERLAELQQNSVVNRDSRRGNEQSLYRLSDMSVIASAYRDVAR